MRAQSHRRKRADMPLHVTYQNAKDGISHHPKNCTFGKCDVAKEYGMDFYVDLDPMNPLIYAEWVTVEKGDRLHHRADVSPAAQALTIIAATDLEKKTLLKKFPRQGMDFVLVNHTVRKNAAGAGNTVPRPGETQKEAESRRAAERARRQELAELREQGLADSPKRRNRRVRARFGGKVLA